MPDEKVSFERDVRPMFREMDVQHMRGFGVLLDDYAYMSQRENAENVLGFLNGREQPQMPPGGPFWDSGQLDRLSRWIAEGCAP